MWIAGRVKEEEVDDRVLKMVVFLCGAYDTTLACGCCSSMIRAVHTRPVLKVRRAGKLRVHGCVVCSGRVQHRQSVELARSLDGS